MKNNLQAQSNIISRSVKEYQPLFLYRPQDKEYWGKKQKLGLTHCYIKEKGELISWKNEEIIRSFDKVTLNIKDDSFKSRFKKMRISKRAPNHWKLFLTNERFVGTILYGKTLKIGDIVDLFKTTFKRRAHKNHYVVGHFPHSMLAGIVIRSKEGKLNCEHIAFIYKNKINNSIVNYTLYFFNYGTQKHSEEFCLKIKDLACKLQLKLLQLAKELSLLSKSEILKIRAEITQNLNNKSFEMRETREKFKNITIKTLYVGGIPLPIFPRLKC